MPLPDKYADEETAEIPEDLWNLYREYRHNAAAWDKLAVELQARILETMGSATAALVAGAKVATYRPTSRYAAARIQAEYPELTRHYMYEVSRDMFDVELFAKAYPDIAERYRVRTFVLKEE